MEMAEMNMQAWVGVATPYTHQLGLSALRDGYALDGQTRVS